MHFKKKKMKSKNVQHKINSIFLFFVLYLFVHVRMLQALRTIAVLFLLFSLSNCAITKSSGSTSAIKLSKKKKGGAGIRLAGQRKGGRYDRVS